MQKNYPVTLMNEISDPSLRIVFFDLLGQKMAQILLKQIDPLDIYFSKEEEEVIQYFMQEISPACISVHTDTNKCVEKFSSDLQKLTQKDPEQLMVYEQAFKSSLSVLSDETRFHMRVLFNSIRR